MGLIDILQENQQEVAAIFGRLCGRRLTLQLLPCSAQEINLFRSQAGVTVTVRGQTQELHVLIPEGILLPGDYHSPSPTTRSRLSTLAQELAVALLPEDLDATASWELTRPSSGQVERSEGIRRSETFRLRFADEAGNTVGTAAVFIHETAGSERTPEQARGNKGIAGDINPATSLSAEAGQQGQSGAAKRHLAAGPQLSAYVRALLRVPLSVGVTLARRRQPIGTLLQLSPGAIIQFDKSCEDLLDLEVAGRVIAQGEAVKVGDKFGLRILRILSPPERVETLRPKE